MSVALYTMDVGHGLCQVILFPGKRAVVIDGGDCFALDTVNEFLDKYVDVILAYIATHNDQDHVGAARHFLSGPKYQDASTLQKVYFLLDRGSNSPIRMLDDLLRRKEKGTIGELRFGGVNDACPRVVHDEPSEEARLEFLHPQMHHMVPGARAKEKDSELQNQTSACLRLSVGKSTALITGDMDLIGFTRIYDDYGFDLAADVLSVPHHGGRIPGNTGSRSWDNILGLMAPKVAVLSCGYRNEVRKTILDVGVLTAIVAQKTEIYCTQITDKCHPTVAALYPGLVPNRRPRMPQMSGRPQFPSAVACMGTIVTIFDGTGFHVQRGAVHGRCVADIAKILDNKPLCLGPR